MTPSKRERLVESIRRAHSEWQWRSAAVWAAYERWTAAGGALEFAAYRVALDLEEMACRRYRELARHA